MLSETDEIVTDESENSVASYGSTTQSTNKEEGEPLELLEIYELIGVGPFQYLCWLLVALVTFTTFAEYNLFFVILPRLREEFSCPEFFENVLIILILACTAVFSVISGIIADKYGRKVILTWSMIGSLLAAIGSASAPNEWVFFTATLIQGACAGANFTVAICYSVEYAESKYRALGTTIFALFAIKSSVVVSALATAVLMDIGWRWFSIMISGSIIPAIVLIFVLPDSPRYLCVSGQPEKAMAALRFMAKLNRKTLPENLKIICFYDADLGSCSMTLNKEYRRSTIALSAMLFGDSFIDYGLIAIIPQLLSSVRCGGTNLLGSSTLSIADGNQDLDISIILTAVAMFGVITALLCAQCIGRLLLVRLASFITMIVTIGLLMDPHCVYDSFFRAFSIMLYLIEAFVKSIILIMIPESFPTYIRSTATGVIVAWASVGGAFGTATVHFMFFDYTVELLGILVFISFFTLVGTLIFKKETRYAVLKEI